MARGTAVGGVAMISTVGLSKHYGAVAALKGLTLDVKPGEVFGLLGPNGSGKTTTIRLLLGLLRPSAGTAKVAGFDSWSQSVSVRRVVSYLPGELRLPGYMNGYKLLKFLADLRGGESLDRAVSIAERVMDLDLSRRIRGYSTGMKQKLALAQAFSDPVDLLILDEPTSALDPSARGNVISLVREARESGQTVIFSGHVLSEVEQVADRVGIMRLGRLMTVEDMHTRRALRMILLRFDEPIPERFPEELELTVRDRPAPDVLLLEHRGATGPLLHWLATRAIADLAIGTEDLRSLYDKFHGPNAVDDSPDGTDS